MKLRTRAVLQLTALLLALAAFSFASDDTYLYIVHGIPGRDIADNLNPGYPVDVLVNGKSCLIHGLTFGNTDGPYTLIAGTYELQISAANTLAPCTNAPVITSQVTLLPGTNVTAVAAISGTEPVLLQFADDLGPVVPGNGRFVFAQAADAPALQATLTQLFAKTPKTFTLTSAPGTEEWVGVPAGTYLVQISAAGTTTLLTSEQITLLDQSVTLSYAAGEELNNTVGLVNRTIRDVF